MKTKNKQIVAVDIDDVLSSQNEAVMHFMNEHYGLGLTIEDYSIEGPYWEYWNTVWKVDAAEADKRIEAFYKAEGAMMQQPLDQVIEVLTELKKKYDLVVITARHNDHTEITHRWLNQHFPGMFNDVHFVHVWDSSKKVSKAQICKEIGAGYLIDDNLEHCELALEAGVTPLLFGEYGWNKKPHLPKGMRRFKDWQEIKEYFNEQ